MTKSILKKVRSWDENIGKLIVFAVTIIIAVGVLGTLAYFYNQSRNNAIMESLLTSTATKWADLKTKGLCGNDTGYITYDAMINKYTLHCSGFTGGNCKKVKEVWGIILSGSCPDGTTTTTGVSYSVASTQE